MEKQIVSKLYEIEEKEDVRILFAVESGSRAWGFASPDSDYDVRFLYVRKKEDYLRLDERRDVIEVPLDDVFDINGWDVKKALRLLYKSNPTIFEWCASPIIYRTSPEFEKLKMLLPFYFSRKKLLYHYWHMAKTNHREYLKTDQVNIKKYFYVLRPLLAAKWIVDKDCPPPMLFSELVEAELEDKLKPQVEQLLKMKQELPEMGFAPKNQALTKYIENMMEEMKNKADEIITQDNCGWEYLNHYFMSLLDFQ